MKSSAPKKRTFVRPVVDKGKFSQPFVTTFGNAGAVFGKDSTDNSLHPQVIKLARKTGTLNLSNKGLTKVPEKVFYLNEVDADEQKKMTVDMSMDDSGDRWWEQNELLRLTLSSNVITTIDPLIGNLGALQLLDLCDNRLANLPPEMSELKCLTKLLLSHNDLKSLPESLCRLDDLRVLSIDHNNMESLPDDIGSLCVLEQLDASHNCLEGLPKSIGYLNRLNKLNVSDNKLTALPLEIADLFGLVNLDLTRNKLKTLPKTMGNLPKLEELSLRQNYFTQLPPLTCPNLKELYLGANKIKVIDEASIEALTNLRVLDLSDNGIEELPDSITLLQQIQRFDMSNNYLSNLPLHMGLLQHLRALTLEGNPLRLIRRDIVQRGTPALLKYLASKLSEPPTSYPGFADFTPETRLDDDGPPIPDQYEMRNMRAMTYNQKAKHIPDKLFENGKLAKVRTANISQNVLSEVPERLSDLAPFLSELNLSHNCLTSLPDFLGDLKNLQFIDVQNNRLTELPEGLARLKDLREINMSFNRFTQIPSVVYQLSNLEILFANDNKITEIAAESFVEMSRLATLDLRNNDIGFVPPLLGKTQLNTLLLEGNGFRVPRHDILAKGSRFLLNYLKSRIADK